MAGEILFELEEDDHTKPWKDRLESIPGVAKVRRLGPRDAVKIRGIDALTENEAILKAVSDTTAMTEEENEQAQIVRAILGPWQERVVVVLLPSRAAKELCSKDKFKIGWSNARARAAQDLLGQVMQERGATVAVVSEPARAKSGGGKWYHSGGNKAAIWVGDPGARIELVWSGAGAVMIKLDDREIIRCYFSPNRPLAQFKAFWDKFPRLVERTGRESIVTEDGLATADWVCCNVGARPTCVSSMGTTIIDVTFATREMAENVKNWQVLDLETLSNHLYISYEIEDGRTTGAQSQRPPTTWNCRKIRWGKLEKETRDLALDLTDDAAGDLRDVLSAICNRVMPKNKPGRRRNAYWWSDAIASERSRCERMRRRIQKDKRRNICTRDAQEEYKEVQRRLRRNIAKRKDEVWRDLLKTVEQDPWGKAYKVVCGKLAGRSRTMLEEDEHRRVLSMLFPDGPLPEELRR
ncbi:PREDICTED: uncharacterized protein LOC108576829 [Habropoda laboriosa]|uniref:uncharacterized protein LOC108576829 n=1 Tax=Habropoda laboriosa TaxID=597456 RepID=UPI00083DE597|nr:PREDICTED: uncharacterized protein LOC108576829 [Habropoda laboriosa]